MSLSDIAEGLVTSQRQQDRGVAVVDRTDRSLAVVLEEYTEALAPDASTAADLVRAYTSGESVGDAAHTAGMPPVEAAKTLHRLGFEGLTPMSPLARDILQDWLRAEISRADALALTDASEREFALATYIETHDPLAGARETIRNVLSSDADAMVEKRDALADTMTGSQDLL